MFSFVSKSRPGAAHAAAWLVSKKGSPFLALHSSENAAGRQPLNGLNGGCRIVIAAPAAALGQMRQRGKISAQHSWMHYPGTLIYRRAGASARVLSFQLF